MADQMPLLACCIRMVIAIMMSIFWTTVAGGYMLIEYLKFGNLYLDKKEHQKPRCLEGWTHGFATLKSIKMHYVEMGELGKPLMIFVHGFPEFWYSWRHQMKHFQNDYHCLAIDLRGYGDTDKPEGIENYNALLIIEDIRQLIEYIGQDKAIIVGHDWGAALSWMFAMKFPDYTEKLVIMNCPHPKALAQLLKTPKQMLKSWYVFFFQCPVLPEMRLMARDMRFLGAMFRGKTGGLINQQNFTDDDMEAWKYTFGNKDAFTFPINFYRHSFRRFRPPSYEKDFMIKAPTLILWGTEDNFLEKKGAEMSIEMCENGRVVYVEKCSHWVQQDCPEEVNKQMEKFLKE